MLFPSFITCLAFILSLFTLASALPTIKNQAAPVIAEVASPRSLLGRRYMRWSSANSSPRAAREISDIARDGLSRRADRFQAIQHKIARNAAAERIVHDDNLLSNQSLDAPQPPTQAPAATAPAPVPQPTPSARGRKHSKSAEKKTAGDRTVKKA